VDNCHRLGAYKTQAKYPRPVIVKFVSYLVRKKVWLNKKTLKGTGFLIKESLTKKRAALYKKAKDTFGWKQTWTQDGKVFVVGRCGEKMCIVTDSDLDRATQQLKPDCEESDGCVSASCAGDVDEVLMKKKHYTRAAKKK